MEITKNSIIGDVLDQYPDTAELFFSIVRIQHCKRQKGVRQGGSCPP